MAESMEGYWADLGDATRLILRRDFPGVATGTMPESIELLGDEGARDFR